MSDMERGQSDTEIYGGDSKAAQDKYTPTCHLCGRGHWPLDPSCTGKKGGKAIAKAKAKEERIAQKEAKRMAKLAAKAEAKGQKQLAKQVKTDDSARSFAEKISRIKDDAAEAIAKTEGQAEVKLAAERELRGREQIATKETVRAYVEELSRVKEDAANVLRHEQERLGGQVEKYKQGQLETEATAKELGSKLADVAQQLKRESEKLAETDAKFTRERAKRIELERHIEDSSNAYEEQAYAAKAEIAKLKAEAAGGAKKLRDAAAAHEADKAEIAAIAKKHAGEMGAVKAELVAAMKAKKDLGDAAVIAEANKYCTSWDGKAVSAEFGERLGVNAAGALLGICAGDIMHEAAVWCSGDDSAGKVLAKMRAKGCEHVLVGSAECVEGVVAKSDLVGQGSGFLREAVEKWQGSDGDDREGLAVKWVMGRKVETIGADAGYAAMMKKMQQSGHQQLVVADDDGRVLGVVSRLDISIIRGLLKLESSRR